VPEAQEDTGTIFYWSTNAISIIQKAKNRSWPGSAAAACTGAIPARLNSV
jgi:hypothetical protein